MLSLSLDFALGDFQVLGQRRLAGLHAHDLLQVGAIKVELAHNYRRTTIARCQRHTLAADRRHAEVVRDHHGDLVRTGLDPEKSGLLVHRNLLFRMDTRTNRSSASAGRRTRRSALLHTRTARGSGTGVLASPGPFQPLERSMGSMGRHQEIPLGKIDQVGLNATFINQIQISTKIDLLPWAGPVPHIPGKPDSNEANSVLGNFFRRR